MKKQNLEQLIVSSRVRLARNLEDIAFRTDKPDAFDEVASTLTKKNTELVNVARIDALPKKMATALFEQHLISRDILQNRRNGMIVANGDKATNKVCVMLGEEDHIRIQVIEVGLRLKEAAQAAGKLSNDLVRSHKIAHDEKLGFLTCCPTNLGTGMRASVMMFLPALTHSGYIRNVITELRHKRITVRGVYGEGSEATGHMYQLSNQACLGKTENEIIDLVTEAVTWIAGLELDMQARMMQNDSDGIMNRVMQSFGILTHSHMIASSEAVEHLSWLKLGDCLGIIRFKPRVLDDLFFVIQPATLTHKIEQEDIRTRDKIRAKKIADELRLGRIK